MRYKHPKADMHANGIYGGIGSRPAHEAWTPGVTDEDEGKELVPKEWRRLKLQRTRRRPMAADETDSWPAIYVLIMFAIPILIVLGMIVAQAFGLFD